MYCCTAALTQLQECQQHTSPITQVLFTADGSRLISCGADGRVVAYAVSQGCLPIKALVSCPPFAAATAAAGGGGSRTPGSSKGKGSKPGPVSSSSSSGGVCAAVSSDGCWVAVGQAAAAAAGPASGVGPDGGAAVVLFNAGLDAELVIETAATSITRWGTWNKPSSLHKFGYTS
jgi:hypothetical protein